MESVRGETVTSADGRVRVVSRSREVPDVSVRSFLAAHDGPRVHWVGPDGLELAGVGAAARLTSSGPDRFDSLQAAADALFAETTIDGPPVARPRAVGGCAFFDDHERATPWEEFPTAEFVLPHVQLTRGDDSTWLTVTACGDGAGDATVGERLDEVADTVADLPMMQPSGGAPGVLDTRRTTSREDWEAGVRRATERIRDGDLRKVVLALALEVETDGRVDVPDVLERLRRTYPDCYRFLVQPDDGAAFFGTPPERLVRLRDRAVDTEALAGSAPRGGTPEADAELAAELVESEKIQHEQGLVTDAICEQLAPFGEVACADQRVRRLATIQHLQTPIEATLAADHHVLELVEALHPTPAVGGVPPDAAASVIRDTEPFERGWYASPVGWFDAAGDGEFAVAIRSGVADDDRVTLFGGNGIVADSDPGDEWDEVQLKFRPILDELR
jgi:menaquinone-specific isochorismate synthase